MNLRKCCRKSETSSIDQRRNCGNIFSTLCCYDTSDHSWKTTSREVFDRRTSYGKIVVIQSESDRSLFWFLLDFFEGYYRWSMNIWRIRVLFQFMSRILRSFVDCLSIVQEIRRPKQGYIFSCTLVVVSCRPICSLGSPIFTSPTLHSGFLFSSVLLFNLKFLLWTRISL